MREATRYESNPFTVGMDIPVGRKSVRVSAMGEDVLINNETGEVRGTHVISYRKVDSEKFVKLFSQNIALTFNLSSAGLKALNVLVHTVQKGGINKDIVHLDSFTLDTFLSDHSESKTIRLSKPTFHRGLADLVDAKIIAMSKRQGVYYINPNFIFNGDRIAFTNVIERG